MQLKVGTYTGDATDNRPITGIGFQPDFVLIKSNSTQLAAYRFANQVGDLAFNCGHNPGAAAANIIQSIDSGGFTIGTDATVNTNTVVYYYIAIKDSGGGDFKVGTYTGNGVDDRNITGVGFQPDWVFIKGNSAANTEPVIRDSEDVGDTTHFMFNATMQSNQIQSLIADGFQIGTAAQVNTNLTVYYYVAFKERGGTTSVNAYVGDGSDDRSITGTGFQPEVVFIANDTSQAADIVPFRTQDMAGDNSGSFENIALTANFIQALQANGFQVGSASRVNRNASNFHYLALKGAAPGAALLWSFI